MCNLHASKLGEFDVIVIGGGTAGVIAAVQAGRAGAKTLLVEKNGMLGGTMTVGGVNFPGMFHAWGRQVIAGIGWDLVTRCVAECGGKLPDFSGPAPSWNHGVHVNLPVYAALCDEAVVGAGVELLLHTMVAAVADEPDAKRVTFCTKTGLAEATASVLIDCTGDANAVSLAGYEVNVSPECQPATLVCKVSGYDPVKLDFDAIDAAYVEQVRQGELLVTDGCWDTTRPSVRRWLSGRGGNCGHVGGGSAHDSFEKTRLELRARESVLRMFRFLRSQPGLENFHVEFIAPECGVRETVTIVGNELITVDDYSSGKRWADAVCYSYYPIDLHTIDGTGINGRPLDKGAVPTIPRGSMLPAGSTNVIVAGRCISSDRLANSALRTQSTCMATGQAAGAIATLAARTHTAAGKLPMSDIHALLKEHGAIVPE